MDELSQGLFHEFPPAKQYVCEYTENERVFYVTTSLTQRPAPQNRGARAEHTSFIPLRLNIPPRR